MFEKIEKILIIKPSALGDIVHSLPFLAVLRKTYPKARIDWVVAHGLHLFLENHPLIDKLWIIRKDEWKQLRRLGRSVREIRELKKGLRAVQYDVSIDLSGLLRSGIITWFAGAKLRLGFKESDEGSPFFYTHKVHGSMNIHAIDRYLQIAKFMGCETDTIEYPFAPFDTNPAIMKELPEKYIVISPSAGKEANRWPAGKFGRLAAKLDEKVVVIAAANEAAVADEMVRHANGNAISIAGRTGLTELLAVIKKASFVVCNDTGPQHIAAALNVPVFAVFGPANPVRTGPYGDIHTVIQKDFHCIPCYAHQPCQQYDFRCMKELSVDEVWGQIKKRRPAL